MIAFTDELLRERLLRRAEPGIIEFWAPWCAWCALLRPKTELLSRRYEGRVVVGRLNVVEYEATAQELGIEYVPGLAFFSGGRLVARWYGDLPAQEVIRRVEGHERFAS